MPDSRSGPPRRGPSRALLILALAACAPAASEQGDAEPDGRAAPVGVVGVEAGDFRRTVRGIGTLRAVREAGIRPEVTAKVEAVHFEEGRAVEEDALLFTLDDERLRFELVERRRALAAAKARAALAEKQFERAEELLGRGVASKDEWDRAKAELEAARAEVRRLEAALDVARERLEDTRIRAPFAGTLSHRAVDVGDLAKPGDVLVRLYDAGQLDLELLVAERHAEALALDQKAEVAVSAVPGRAFEGRVAVIDPAVEAATRQLRVTVRLPDGDGLLRPGFFASAEVIVGVREDRPAIPERALVATREGFIVFVVEEGVARERQVEVGLRRPDLVEIRGGLEVGETVVARGHMALTDGQPVEMQAPEQQGEEGRQGAPADGGGAARGAGDGAEASGKSRP